MSAQQTLSRMRLIAQASRYQVAVMDCLEQARAEPRRRVSFWWLDAAAANRRHYAAARAAIAKVNKGA